MKNHILKQSVKLTYRLGVTEFRNHPKEKNLLTSIAMIRIKRRDGGIMNLTDASPTKQQMPLSASELTEEDIKEIGDTEF